MEYTNPKKIIPAAILLCVALAMLVQVLPTMIISIGNLSTISNLPFASFFATNGVVILALGGAVVIAVVSFFIGGASKR